MLGPRIYWERLRFHRPFIFSVISSRQKDSISVCLHKRAPPFQQLENFLFDCPSNMGRRKKKKKNKKKKERAVYRKKGGREGGGERERGHSKTIRQISLLPSRRQSFDDNCLVYLVAMEKKRIRFEYDNFSLSLPFFSSSYDVSKE